MIRGWLRMIFLLIDIAALSLLFGAGNRPFVLMLVGLSLSVVNHILERATVRRLLEVLLRLSNHNRYSLGYPALHGSMRHGCGILRTWRNSSSHALSESRNAMSSAGGITSRDDHRAAVYRKYLFVICLPLMLAALPWTLESAVGGYRRACKSLKRRALRDAAGRVGRISARPLWLGTVRGLADPTSGTTF